MDMTYDEYEDKCTTMEDMHDKFPTKPYFPAEADIIIMAGNLEKYYDFIVYLVSTNPTPETTEEVNSMKLLNKIIADNTVFAE